MAGTGPGVNNCWCVEWLQCSLVSCSDSVNLKERAAATGVSYATARRRYEAGTLPVPTYRLGRLIMVGEPVTPSATGAGHTVVYARVSSDGQKADLDRQVARVTTWVTGQRLAVSRVVTEVGSALNGRRSKSRIYQLTRWEMTRSTAARRLFSAWLQLLRTSVSGRPGGLRYGVVGPQPR